MRHEASKVPPNDAVPRRPLALVKLHRRLAEVESRGSRGPTDGPLDVLRDVLSPALSQ